MNLGFLLVLLITVLSYSSCGNESPNEERTTPEEFSEFADCKAHYRVFAACPDSICHVKIKALMTAYIDTVNNLLYPQTTYLLKHSSGETIKIETKKSLLSLEEFRYFVNSHTSTYNDTVLVLTNSFVIQTGDEYNLSDLNAEFCFMDVGFRGYPSLLIKRKPTCHCFYYDVYSIASKAMSKVDFPPYNEFKTATSCWMLGYGTNINYARKEIIVPSLGENSCSDFGTLVYDCYKLDEETEKFVHHRKTESYDICR